MVDHRKALLDLLRWRSTHPPKPPSKPKKTTRDVLLAAIADRLKRRRRPFDMATVENAVDETLAQLDAFSRPYLENDWSGGEVLHQLRLWRKGRL